MTQFVVTARIEGDTTEVNTYFVDAPDAFSAVAIVRRRKLAMLASAHMEATAADTLLNVRAIYCNAVPDNEHHDTT